MITIYKILNTITDKFYLGSTKQFEKRITKHKRELKNNVHHCIYLQRSYNKHGVGVFSYSIIETSENIDQFQWEQTFLDELDFSKCYNVSKFAGGGDLISYHPNRNEIIQKISETLKRKYKDKEIILPNVFGENNNNWKGGITLQTACVCGNVKKYNSNVCNYCRDRNGINNPFYGKFHTEEVKKKMSNLMKGIYKGSQEKSVIIDNITYKSLSEASRQLSINSSTILFRIRSKNERFSNYNYIENSSNDYPNQGSTLQANGDGNSSPDIPVSEDIV